MENILSLHRTKSCYIEWLLALTFELIYISSNNIDKDEDYVRTRYISLGQEWLEKVAKRWFYETKNKAIYFMGYERAKELINKVINKVNEKYGG